MQAKVAFALSALIKNAAEATEIQQNNTNILKYIFINLD